MSKSIFLISAIIFLGLLSQNLIECNLTVTLQNYYSPYQFSSPIKYSIANYGVIPYGRRLTGPLQLATPFDACEPPGYAYFDGELDENPLYNVNKYNKDGQMTSILPFILITSKENDCSFTQKSLNASAAGAKLAIIINDNRVHDEANRYSSADDGFGDSVYIPTIFISSKDGKQLEQLYQETLVGGISANPIVLSMEFDVVQTDNVDLKFFVDPPGKANFKLIVFFQRYYKYISSTTTFTPIFQFYQNVGGSNQDNCIRKGRYCTIDYDGASMAGTGAQLAEEYLFQICLHQTFGAEKWLFYIIVQHRYCHQIPNINQCSIQRASISQEDVQKINQCMYPQYTNKDTDAGIQILDKQLEILELSNITAFPTVTVNNVKYQGSMEGKDVMEAVCAYQKRQSKECKKLMNETQIKVEHAMKNSGPNIFIIVVVVVSVLLLFFLFMVVIYRRMVYKDINKEMNAEVNHMVSQYIAFYESKDSSRNKGDDQF